MYMCVHKCVYIYVVYIISYHDTESSIYNPSMLKKKFVQQWGLAQSCHSEKMMFWTHLDLHPKKSNAGDVDVFL